MFAGPQFGAAKSDSYNQADAFILPSLSEGLPMAVLEAWAHGKPVLMTPDCNLPEGFAVRAAIRIGSARAEIVPGLKRLFAMSPDALGETGAQGARLIAEKFNWGKIGEQLVAVSKWTLSGGTPPECVWQG